MIYIQTYKKDKKKQKKLMNDKYETLLPCYHEKKDNAKV